MGPLVLLPLLLLRLGALCRADNITKYLSGMTPYTYAATGHGKPYTPPENCTLTALDAVFRHGSRYPSLRAATAIRSLEGLIERNKERLLLDWMRSWVSPYTNSTAELLCENGADELTSIGRAYRKNFASVLSPYNPHLIRFTSTFVCSIPVFFPTTAHTNNSNNINANNNRKQEQAKALRRLGTGCWTTPRRRRWRCLPRARCATACCATLTSASGTGSRCPTR